MVQVTIGNNLKREKMIVDGAMTPRQVMEDYGLEYATGGVHMDGEQLTADKLDKSFDDLGVTEKCYLLKVVKADNANE